MTLNLLHQPGPARHATSQPTQRSTRQLTGRTTDQANQSGRSGDQSNKSNQPGQPELVVQSNQPSDQSNQSSDQPGRVVVDSAWRRLGWLGVKVGVIAGLGVLLFTLIYGFHYVADPGMSPVVKAGDLTLFYRWDKDYRAGDLVVLSYQGETQVRRVIAVAGDSVNITEEGLMINGSLQMEAGIYQSTERYTEGVDFPLVVPDGEVFVLGDAREEAIDSRIYGTVSVSDTQGTVITVLKRRNL